MDRPGRNDRCPCGSGKKYKRCCLERDQLLDIDRRSNEEIAALVSLLGVHPYAAAKLAGREVSEGAQARNPRSSVACWTPRSVAELGFDRIAKELSDLGISSSRVSFAAAAEGRISAWGISDAWAASSAQAAVRKSFLGLAAVWLWKHHLPDAPCFEIADDFITAGYLLPDDHCVEGEAAWWLSWQLIRTRCPPEVATFAAADRALGGFSELLAVWVRDFGNFLYTLAFEDETPPSPPWPGQEILSRAGRGVRFARQVLERFPGEEPAVVDEFRRDLGELLYRAGQPAEGEKVLRALIRDRPHRAAGYVALADALVLPSRSGNKIATPEAREQALALLKQAAAYPVEDAFNQEVRTRIRNLERAPLELPTLIPGGGHRLR